MGVDRRLGRGLDSLISRTTVEVGAGSPAGRLVEIPVAMVDPNPDQPRKSMNEATLDGLAASIKAHGVLQPIVVQARGTRYELVAGERRLRASKRAGLETVPAIILEVGPDKSLELALLENIQREDLGALEEASAYDALIERLGLTHQALADRIGKSRAFVTNSLRLLELPDAVKRLVQSGALAAGQARALLGAPTPADVASLAIEAARNHWSTREVESRVRALSKARGGRQARRVHTEMKSRSSEELRTLFGTKVTVRENDGRGEVALAFYSAQDRDRLLHLLLIGGRSAERQGG